MEHISINWSWGETTYPMQLYSMNVNFLLYQQIAKHQVDQFKPGCLVPSCQLYIKWTRQQEQPVELMHRVKLLGAKKPKQFVILLPALHSPLQGTTYVDYWCVIPTCACKSVFSSQPSENFWNLHINQLLYHCQSKQLIYVYLIEDSIPQVLLYICTIFEYSKGRAYANFKNMFSL